MHNFWEPVVFPLLNSLKPKSVIEVGAADGSNTRQLLAWAARSGSTVDVIDPSPGREFGAAELEADFPDIFHLHRELSVEALPGLAQGEVMLLDGDHNYYTVSQELAIIDRGAAVWPVVLFHDVAWPYGRRDMYYSLETVPEEHRHPARQAGLQRLRSALLDQGGSGRAFFNAEHEGGAGNGVLTAIEDFVESTGRDLHFLAVKGPGGLGILVDAELPTREPSASAVLADAHEPRFAVELSPKHARREYPPAST